MENTLMVGWNQLGRSPLRLRVGAVIAGVALVFAMVVVLQQPAQAAPTGGSVAAAVAAPAIGDGISAQVPFTQIFCSVLLSVANAFEGTPFFAFIRPILNALLGLFGCGVSG